MTNDLQLAQLAAQAAKQAGFHVSGAEIAMALTLVGTFSAGVMHAAHLALNGWRRVGGFDGLKAFFFTGK